MERKRLLLIILVAVGLIISIGVGFAVAHGINENEDKNDMTEMNMIVNDMMMKMMNNMNEMYEEMMDGEIGKEMLEHMKSCPMMKRFNS